MKTVLEKFYFFSFSANNCSLTSSFEIPEYIAIAKVINIFFITEELEILKKNTVCFKKTWIYEII